MKRVLRKFALAPLVMLAALAVAAPVSANPDAPRPLPQREKLIVGMPGKLLQNGAVLIAGAEGDRVRCCAEPECRWMFLEHARNRPGLWCSMEDCGNRAKARRHYLRAKRAS